MTNKEKKEYILKHWNTSNGARISEMLKRYWLLKENKSDDLVEYAKTLFKEA